MNPGRRESGLSRALAVLGVLTAMASAYYAYRADLRAQETIAAAQRSNALAQQSAAVAYQSAADANQLAQEANAIALRSIQEARDSAQEARELAERALRADIALAAPDPERASAVGAICRAYGGPSFRCAIDMRSQIVLANSGGAATSLVAVEAWRNGQALHPGLHPVTVEVRGQPVALPLMVPQAGEGCTLALRWSGGLASDVRQARALLDEALAGPFTITWRLTFANGQVIEHTATAAQTQVVLLGNCP